MKMHKRFLFGPAALLLSVLISVTALADEGQGPVSAEGQALQILSQTRFQPPAGWQWGKFENQDGAMLRYGWSEAQGTPRGVVIILPPFQSSIEEFFETASDLRERGFAVWSLDWREQGGSQRWLANRQKAYSEGLDLDSRDLVQFIEALVRPRNAGASFYFLGESLAAPVALHALHDHPHLVEAASFASPFFGAQGGPPGWLLRRLSSIAVAAGMGENYAAGEHDWRFQADAGLPTDPYSGDRERALMAQGWTLKYPDLREGGYTWRFAKEFFRMADLEQSAGWLGAVETPILIAEVPDDKVAAAPLMTSACRALKECRLLEFPDAKHSLLIDSDPARSLFMDASADFFLRHSSSRSE